MKCVNFQYGLYGFNCESFTSACAEVEPDRANPCQRVLAEREDPDVVDEERRAASMRYAVCILGHGGWRKDWG